jgi:hypothetical protein
MIWVRRALTVPLMLALIILLAIAVFITQINDTAANPDFYNDRMVEADIYDFVYDDVLPAALHEMDEERSADIPIELSEIEREIILIARETFPPDWLQSQFESITATLIPYFVGDTDNFTYTLMLKGRMEAAVDAIEENLLCCAALDHIYNKGISYVAQKLYTSMELPPTVTITEALVEGSLKSVVPEDWLATHLESAVDSFIAYLTKDAEHFTISLPIEEVYTDDDLLLLLGAGNEAYLDEAWNWIAGEWAFTDDDLMAELDTDDEETLQDVRNWINSGYAVTEDDLREALSDNQGALDDFDNIRSWIHTGRTWLWSLWLIPVIFIIAIGFLGGRRWKSRAAWALGSLLLSSIIVLIATVLIYLNVAEPEIEELKLDTAEYQGVEQVLAEKGNELIELSSDSFVNGMKASTIYVIIASGVGLLGVVGWYIVDSRRRPLGTASSD